MATYTNRSRLFVRVKQRHDLYRSFAFDAAQAARAYYKALQAQGYKPTLGQLEDTILVRVRAKGRKPQSFTATSYEEAERIATRIEDEQRRGIFIDYGKSVHVTVAALIERYIREECPKHKAGTIEAYKLQAFLDDSKGELKRQLACEKAARERGEDGPWANGRHRPKRAPMENLEWLDKPFAWVEPGDIEDYVRARLEAVAPATVDRELDLLAAVFNVAIKTWRYIVPLSPMDGVRRPRYWNERNRRLKGDEEARLLAAAREDDQRRSVELHQQRLLEPFREEALALSSANRKRFMAQAAKGVRPQAEASYVHVPLYETWIRFQLATAARRGESLALQWRDVDFAEQTAYLPETKNGTPRTLPLRKSIADALSALPRDDERVFPVPLDALKNAWQRICQRAGIEDLHVHDLRHEGISRVADTGMFSLVDLQTFSGHRDPRCLMRYAHLCAPQFARRLTDALDSPSSHAHKGRKRLFKGATVTLRELMLYNGRDEMEEADSEIEALGQQGGIPPSAGHGERSEPPNESLPANVLRFPVRRHAR